MQQMEHIGNTSNKVCPECGQNLNEQVESYMYECERCLAKKEE